MANTSVKKGTGLYLDIVALVLAVAGIVAMVMSSTSGYEFDSMALYLGLTVASVLLVVVAIYLDFSSAKKGPSPIASIALGIAIFLLIFSGVQVVGSRALTISGLFSWNSMDTGGWDMFYKAVASAGCLVVSALFLLVGCFLPVAKKN